MLAEQGFIGFARAVNEYRFEPEKDLGLEKIGSRLVLRYGALGLQEHSQLLRDETTIVNLRVLYEDIVCFRAELGIIIDKGGRSALLLHEACGVFRDALKNLAQHKEKK